MLGPWGYVPQTVQSIRDVSDTQPVMGLAQPWIFRARTGGSLPEGHPLGNLDPNPTFQTLITGPFSPLNLLGPSSFCLCLNLILSRGSSPARPRRPPPSLPSLHGLHRPRKSKQQRWELSRVGIKGRAAGGATSNSGLISGIYFSRLLLVPVPEVSNALL